MTINPNDAWLEAAYENFQTAVDEKQYDLARAVIADISDAGYPNTARLIALDLEDIIKDQTPQTV